MPNLILLSTPLTRTIQFDKLDEMGVDLYRPIFSQKTKLILGYPMTGRPSRTRLQQNFSGESKT